MTKIIERLSQRFAELERTGAALVAQDRGDGIEEVPMQPFYTWAISAQHAIQSAFGQSSAHAKAFQHALPSKSNTVWSDTLDTTRGVFLAAKSDIDGGHLFQVQQSVVGEVVGDWIGLAKAALAERHHTVAAVLASAALEDALKRYASTEGIDTQDKTMEDVVNSLKAKGLVSGPQKSLLAAMPKLRNKAMHADWDAITPEDVGSLIGFTEQFLLSHFQ